MESQTQAPESRFSDRVENYIKFRPGYPGEILEILRSEAGLSADSVVADIGSGTGISAAMLLDTGCSVFAVEPNSAMREAAERLLADREKFHSINGTAEQTTLPDKSVDLIVAAQAFHWFHAPSARLEFDRILKLQGWLALIWNVRRLDSTPFLYGYEQLLLKYGSDYSAVRHENVHSPELKKFFKDGQCAIHSAPNIQLFDFEGLKGRLLSSSYIPAENNSSYQPMLKELEVLFRDTQVNGKVGIEYDTQIYLGH